ncbi:hypothetical protein NM688_g7841 [Phlebia brevispora]|uniref:Uncharacterized protein n=1 Tax=Phlebia brevispora TaxID=194682 RepID=A0ACC1S0L2_9APHY|nr:hypothetical protein NM688_g7841 [Phlebia brevispora]
MKLCTVPENHILGEEDNLRDHVRAEVVKLLDERDIKLTSVDLVRFTWVEKSDDQEDVESEEGQEDEESEEDQEDEADEANLNYDDIAPVTVKPVVDGAIYTAPAVSGDILELLRKYDITDVEVAYRESEATLSADPELFPPTLDLDPLQRRHRQPVYCTQVEDELYAVTARHVLLKDSEPNVEYYYVAGPKKKVAVMGPKPSTDYLALIQGYIDILIDTAGGENAQKSAGELAETQGEPTRIRTKIYALKQYFVEVKTKWGESTNRIIGHVVWAPPLGVATSPCLFTEDFCVIKLVKDKFRNFRNNVPSLGPEISPAEFNSLMYDRFDGPHEFEYPEEGLLKLHGFLSDENIRNSHNKTLEGDPIRCVIKRGPKTLTTVGDLSGYLSHVRRNFLTGEMNLTEVAIHPHNNDTVPFSRDGDSGSIIVDASGVLVALLTGGAGQTDLSDITNGIPMFWLWNLILAKFPGANLYWDDDDN